MIRHSKKWDARSFRDAPFDVVKYAERIIYPVLNASHPARDKSQIIRMNRSDDELVPSPTRLLIVRGEDGTDVKRVPDVNHRVCIMNTKEENERPSSFSPSREIVTGTLSTIVIPSNELYRDGHLIHPRARRAQCTLAPRSLDCELSDPHPLKFSQISGLCCCAWAIVKIPGDLSPI